MADPNLRCKVLAEMEKQNENKKNIVVFCKETPDTLFNPELGFLYISYLNDRCKRVNIRFDSFVHQLQNRDFMVITSNLTF